MDENTVFEWLEERIEGDDLTEISDFLHTTFDGAHEYREGAEARISEFETSDAALRDEIQKLKARNYDLLMQAPADDNIDGDGAVVDVVEDDGEVIHIDNLFEEESEE